MTHPELTREILQSDPRHSGYGQMALGEKFGISRITIRKLVRRETWKHL